MMNENQETPFFTPPSLPKGGGTLGGSSGALSVGGPDGGASWHIPLPVSAAPARGLAPELALAYSNGGGNGVYGMGWQLSLPAIRLRTQHGVPRYDGTDRLNGPRGDELLRAQEAVRTETRLPFADTDSGTYTVTRYLDRFSGLNSRIECWQEVGTDGAVSRTFWIDFTPDGGLALYGWSADARLADPQDPSRVAEWHIEETVTARGEHILWRWRQEDNEQCSAQELADHPHVAGLYPDTLYWMNRTPALHFLRPGMGPGDAWENEWLALLVFDYGERGTSTDQPPPLVTTSAWPAREDALSLRRYGFEVRTRRLCHDILLWHRTAMMADDASQDATAQLVSRLHLSYASSTLLTQLCAAQILAYEADGTVVSMPPVEFALSEPPEELPDATHWQHVPALDGFNHSSWQMADLYGEGIPGLLYQDDGAWWYRAPVRDGEGAASKMAPGYAGLFDAPLDDRVTWAAATPLHRLPFGGRAQLTDLEGNGQPELIIAVHGMRGSFTLQPNGRWGGFKPFARFPAEFDHPAALQADLTGTGLTDLVMIGPASVRLWPSAGPKGWEPDRTVAHPGRSLPHPSGDGTRMVAISDITGGGLSDLVEITADGVTAWPSLGHGRFGNPLSLPGFSLQLLRAKDGSALAFDPERIYLADTDGTGVADLLVIGQKGIHVFANQSGNALRYKGVIPPPAGVTPDATWRLQVADVQGLGMGSLVLTVPHMKPRSWVLNFSATRPWLLTTVVDNIGGRTELAYRSSAQGWLDEKAALQASGQAAVSCLPFPVHTVRTVTQINEITGLTLGSETRYLGGVWDGSEREFAGFRCVVQTDRNSRSEANAAARAVVESPPVRTCTWFYTGNEAVDSKPLEHAREDIDKAFNKGQIRFTAWQEGSDKPEEPGANAERRRKLYRAVRGQVMRTEVYGEDDHPAAATPYSISRQRLQVRACDSLGRDGKPDRNNPVTQVTVLETLSLACERIAVDPLVTQTIVLQLDAYGVPLDSVSISYPRQLTPAQVEAEERARDIYPKTLPGGVIKETADTQQYDCWVTLTRNRVHHLTAGHDFVVGLGQDARSDLVWWGTTHPDGNPEARKNRPLPEGGFTADNLAMADLLAEPGSLVFSGYTKTQWRGIAGNEQLDIPTRQGLVAWTETALLDEISLQVLRPNFDQTLADLVDACLNDTGGVIDPAVLRRLRERVQAHMTPDVFFELFMAFAVHQEQVSAGGGSLYQAALQAMQEALKGQSSGRRSIETDALWAALGTHGASGGVPRTQLCSAVQAYADQHPGDDEALAALKQALIDPAITPDLLYWQVVSAALATGQEHHQALATLRDTLGQPVQSESLADLLQRGGYKPLAVPFEPQVKDVWGGLQNITAYHDQSMFWVAKGVRENEQVPQIALTYSPHLLSVVGATDGSSFTSQVTALDWRFLSPVQVTDANGNTSEATLDALGRVQHTRFHGSETPAGASEAVSVGYSTSRDKPFTPPATVEQALALNTAKGVPVHEAFTTVIDSWMPLAVTADGQLTGQRCGSLARARQDACLRRDAITAPDVMAARTPPHVIRVQTDRYDDDPQQQVRVQVIMHGGGQVLQTAMLNAPGEAFVRTAEGALETGADGKPIVKHAAIRWAVTGRAEYDNKGNTVRAWHAYYLDDWRLVSGDGIYADTHFYDALGREFKVMTAAGYERRAQAFPWFTVAEDENDTAAEVLARQATGEVP